MICLSWFSQKSAPHDLIRAQDLLQTAMNKQADSAVFLLMSGVGLRRQGHAQASVTQFEKLQQILEQQSLTSIPLQYQMGLSYFSQMEFDRARQLFHSVATNSQAEQPYICLFWEGLCLLMQDQEAEGMAMMKNAIAHAKTAGNGPFKGE